MAGTDPAVVLADAARRAQRAPSILNTQPWRWRVHDQALHLFADRSRQLHAIDPDGRLLTISCGAALHHARAALAATGHGAVVQRFPDPADADLLAVIRLSGDGGTHFADAAALDAMRRRHTERRPLAATVAVPGQAISLMKRAAEREDAWLYQIPPAQIPALAAATERAARAEARRPDYRAELDRWTHRPWTSGEGVPAETMTAQVHRPVPMRDFTDDQEALLDPGFGDDRFAEFFILATTADTPQHWLRAGEATSAVWLTATAAGLVGSVMSDVVEIPEARELLRGLLHPAGCPQLVLRMGVDMQPPPHPETPRRPPDVTVTA